MQKGDKCTLMLVSWDLNNPTIAKDLTNNKNRRQKSLIGGLYVRAGGLTF